MAQQRLLPAVSRAAQSPGRPDPAQALGLLSAAAVVAAVYSTQSPLPVLARSIP
eukprot:m.481929 g.481929  ORF g.481929 m.481929 type:complete len:54 (+) comp57184_c1_seq32:2021-2182(+)